MSFDPSSAKYPLQIEHFSVNFVSRIGEQSWFLHKDLSTDGLVLSALSADGLVVSTLSALLAIGLSSSSSSSSSDDESPASPDDSSSASASLLVSLLASLLAVVLNGIFQRPTMSLKLVYQKFLI